ncbi:MAG: insulinase family protein, partial [candidate division Zixibacteria bacterium]|nr:insulinase family protein [candidate division Zixibacteria bacterium]NIR64989.1 insulinase family protein [candidate division Zixibacteria bacterium]NIS18034.1 insulinase family protein [candidate division Zixibacteria bacterium]NIS48814.1 insulinase family protein [candidate division Zixibacteria bacterium]NIT54314.1 insulinase family protein [candidate division Zixibacteria bacterium]
MQKKSLLVLPLFIITLFTASNAEQLNIDVKEHVLDNGMKILVVENHDAPVFSTIIRVKVGAVDERPGQTGLSHFLEHMMFKGTKIFGTTDYKAEENLMAP